MVTFTGLVELYLGEINLDGREAFVAGTLADLRAKALNGEVVSTSELDKSVTLRQSALPVEERLRAAYEALNRFDNADEGPASFGYGLDFSHGAAGI